MDLADKLKAVLDHLNTLPKTRERALAVAQLETCAFWASCAVNGVSSPIGFAQAPLAKTSS